MSLLLYSKIQRHNCIRARSLKPTIKYFLDYAVRKNMEVLCFEKICHFWALKLFQQPLYNLKPKFALKTSMIFTGTCHLLSITLIYTKYMLILPGLTPEVPRKSSRRQQVSWGCLAAPLLPMTWISFTCLVCSIWIRHRQPQKKILQP